MSSAPTGSGEVLLPPNPPRLALEILSAAATTTLFLAAFLVLPVAGPFALPFAPVSTTRIAHRRGAVAGLTAAAIAASLLFLVGWAAGGLSEAASGALFAAVLTALPALFAGAVHRGSDPSRAYLALCGTGFALACGVLLAWSNASDATMSREIDRGFDEWARLAAQPGRAAVDSETAARLHATLEAARTFCKRFWIGLIGVSWILGGAISFYVGAWAARPAPSALAARFEALRIPAPVVAVFVATGAGWALAPAPASRIAGNLLWPLVALYFVAGLSIICHFARKWLRSRILRVGLYALVIYVPINVGVVVLGLFDWYADFRRRGRGTRES